MFNDKLLGLLMIIIEYLMILLILMKLTVVNSLHREYLEMNGVHMVVLPCAVSCDVCCNGCFNVNKCCVVVKSVVPLCSIDKPHVYSYGIDMPNS